MFDTHCHLNFKAFQKTLPDVINRAREAGVPYMLIPGTDLEASSRAVEIADKFENTYAAVGVHPHHVFDTYKKVGLPHSHSRQCSSDIKSEDACCRGPFRLRHPFLNPIEELLKHNKVVAVGEVGIDKHQYAETKYGNYSVDHDFVERQKKLFIEQIRLAVKYKKSLIIHNREAVDDTLSILKDHWDIHLQGRTVFHCCEPDVHLLAFAKKNQIYIGVDGDITYSKEKQEFIKTVPLELLVLETDSPFLLPEPLRSQKKYPNEPANITLISSHISKLVNTDENIIQKVTTQNAKRLFGLPI